MLLYHGWVAMIWAIALGKLYGKDFNAELRRKYLLWLGTGLLLLFVVLPYYKYGDPVSWRYTAKRCCVQFFFSLSTLINILHHSCTLLATIGAGMLFLAMIEKVQNRFTAIMNVYGRVPMLYYILHFYLIITYWW